MKKKLVATILCIVAVCSLGVSAFALSEPITATISVEVNGKAVVAISAVDGAPTPKDTQIDIEKKGNFEVLIDEPGTYQYRVFQVDGDDKNVVYDDSVYDVHLYITTDDDGALSSTVYVNEVKNAEKTNVVQFENTTNEETPPPENTPSNPNAPSNPNNPDAPKPNTTQIDVQTGISDYGWIIVGILACTFFITLTAYLFISKQSKDEEQVNNKKSKNA